MLPICLFEYVLSHHDIPYTLQVIRTLGETIAWYNELRRPESTERELNALVDSAHELKAQIGRTFPEKGARCGLPSRDDEEEPVNEDAQDSDPQSDSDPLSDDDDSVGDVLEGEDSEEEVDKRIRVHNVWKFPKFDAMPHLPVQKMVIGGSECCSAQPVEKCHTQVKRDVVMTNQMDNTLEQVLTRWTRHTALNILTNASSQQQAARMQRTNHPEPYVWPHWVPVSGHMGSCRTYLTVILGSSIHIFVFNCTVNIFN
jgi:hypothetical protein